VRGGLPTETLGSTGNKARKPRANKIARVPARRPSRPHPGALKAANTAMMEADAPPMARDRAATGHDSGRCASVSAGTRRRRSGDQRVGRMSESVIRLPFARQRGRDWIFRTIGAMRRIALR